MTVGMIKIEAAFARSAGGKARNNMAVPTGVSMPPPTPWRTLKAINSLSDVARPQRMEAPVNAASAKRNTRLVPILSPIHPEAGMKTASPSR